jgi:hypothetical protein
MLADLLRWQQGRDERKADAMHELTVVGQGQRQAHRDVPRDDPEIRAGSDERRDGVAEVSGAEPGCVSEEMGWPGVELVLLSCPVLKCCRTVRTVQYHAAQVGARRISKRLRKKSRSRLSLARGPY